MLRDHVREITFAQDSQTQGAPRADMTRQPQLESSLPAPGIDLASGYRETQLTVWNVRPEPEGFVADLNGLHGRRNRSLKHERRFVSHRSVVFVTDVRAVGAEFTPGGNFRDRD